jgi:DNA-directed RNA polymerase specialized sigma subunit
MKRCGANNNSGGGGAMMKEQIHESEWFKQTVSELRQYRFLQKRIEIIEIQLRKQCGPDAKVIANYGAQVYGGQNPDEISRLEVELEEKQIRLQAIEKSLEALDEQDRRIIELKFKQGYNDRQIYETKEFMSSKTFYDRYNEAITEIAKCLGHLEM